MMNLDSIALTIADHGFTAQIRTDKSVVIATKTGWDGRQIIAYLYDLRDMNDLLGYHPTW